MPTISVAAYVRVRATLATFGSAAGVKVSGVGRQQLLKQATPRLRLGLSVRLIPGRSNMPELQGDPLHPFRPQEVHVGVAVVLTFKGQ